MGASIGHLMHEDVEKLYSANIRLSPDAYEFLMRQTIAPSALRKMLNTDSAVLGINEVRTAIYETSKIPTLEPTFRPRAPPPPPPAVSAIPSYGPPSPSPGISPTLPSALTFTSSPAPSSKLIESSAPLSHSNTPLVPPPSSFSARAVRQAEFLHSPNGPLPAALNNASAPPWARQKHPEAAPLVRSGRADGRPMMPPEPGPGAEPKPVMPPDPSAAPPVSVEFIRPSPFHPVAKEYSPRIVIHEHRDVSGQSRCVGSLDDFVAYFRDRFERETAILRSRPSASPILRTDQVAAHPNENVRLLVMVTDKRITKNENLFMEVEDEQGQLKVIVSQKDPCFAEAKTILRDDIIAIDGRMGPNFFSLKAVTWPDLPVIRAPPKVEEDLAVAYLSDLHVGSRYFLEKPFKRFIRWLWGEEGRTELAGKVKYIIIAGDVCDGIGVYPTQEKELTIKDIYAQYAAFDALVESLPDHIEVIVSPGNHDAVRRGEPQPFIPMDLIRTDVKKVGSPTSLELEGLRHLVYHGTSLDSVISNISGLSYAKPEGPMTEILKRRHLSPIYGENLIVPELRDYMVIDQEPDVLHMGHIHKNAAMKYRGTLMVNSGTFQERTDFQVKMGHLPTPGIVPVLELKTQQLYHLKFLEETIA